MSLGVSECSLAGWPQAWVFCDLCSPEYFAKFLYLLLTPEHLSSPCEVSQRNLAWNFAKTCGGTSGSRWMSCQSLLADHWSCRTKFEYVIIPQSIFRGHRMRLDEQIQIYMKNGVSYTGVTHYGYICVKNHIRHVNCTNMTSGSLGFDT